MKTYLTAVFLFSSLSFCSLILPASQARASDTNAKKPSFLRVLSYDEVKTLNEEARHDYINAIATVLVALSESNTKSKKITFMDQLFSLGSFAYAAPLYQCIGGGVPVDTKASTCGVQSYAGFSCAAGKKICNPMVFGVGSNDQPTCHENATTKWCYQNTTLGKTNFLTPVFKENNLNEWNKLRAELEQACNDSSKISEAKKDVAEACGYVRLQMELNEDVRKLMANGYTYKTEGKTLACNDCKSNQVKNNLQDLKKVSASFAGFSNGSGTSLNAAAASAFSGLMVAKYTKSKGPTIAGISGRLSTPMPGCRSLKDHYHHREGHFHAAQDLVASYGAPVKSVASGVVVSSLNGGGYGNRVVVMHKTENGEPFYSTYSHLNSRQLKVGEPVAAGTTVGTMGNTGISYGAHLHFEIIDKNHIRSNPAAYYPNGICNSPSTNLASL